MQDRASRRGAEKAPARLLPVAAVAAGIAIAFGFSVGTNGRASQASPAIGAEVLAVAPEATPPSMPATVEDEAVSTGAGDRYTFNPGDRVKIVVYGREDLPTEYRVNGRGQIAVPTIGIFDVLTKTPQDLEAAVTLELQKTIAYSAFVSVEPLEPVFVTGLVSKPGAYPYSDGMIAIQAATLAGGTLTGTTSGFLPSEAIREAARMRGSELDLAGLLATQARLSAEREGKPAVVMPPRLASLVGARMATTIVAREQQILDQDRQTVARQRQTLQRAVEEAKTEIAAYADEISYIKKQRKLRVSMVEPLQALAKKGLTTAQRVAESELMLVSIDRDAQSAIANLSRARQSLDRSERDLALLELERSIQTDKQLRDTEDKIAKAQATHDGSAKFVSYVAGIPAEGAAIDGEMIVSLEIIRKTKDGRFVHLAAGELTRLMPGDVLRVRASRVE